MTANNQIIQYRGNIMEEAIKALAAGLTVGMLFTFFKITNTSSSSFLRNISHYGCVFRQHISSKLLNVSI